MRETRCLIACYFPPACWLATYVSPIRQCTVASVRKGKEVNGLAKEMLRKLCSNQKGFTLIELLAVMAIVAVLAGIVSVAVGGTGETGRDTQTKQDATTIETAAGDFFADQDGAEVLTPQIQIILSTTLVTPSSLTSTFLENVTGVETVVYSVPLFLSSGATGPELGPKDFDIVIDLDVPFRYDPNLGSLLMEVRNISGTIGGTFRFDFVNQTSPVVARAFALDVTATVAPFVRASGLVTQFTMTPIP